LSELVEQKREPRTAWLVDVAAWIRGAAALIRQQRALRPAYGVPS